MRRIGIDVGGTNTAAVLVGDGGIVAAAKTPTTKDVLTGIKSALGALLAKVGGDPGRVGAVMVGTTHFTNAVVQRRDLAPVAALRIGLPSGRSLPPFADWPEELAAIVRGAVFMIEGGHEVDGRPLAPFDEAAAREAEVTYLSQSELDKRGQSTRLKMIAAEVARDRAKAVVDGARAEVALAGARLSEAETDLAKSTIRSPISGVVLNRAAEPGQIVAASLNAPILFTLAEDLSRMELRVDVDEADIGRVAVGNAARFTVDAFPDRSFPAVITTVRYAPETTDGVVTYKAILSVDNREGLLRPGMTATATISVTEVADTLRVPAAALRFEPPQSIQTGSGRGGNGLLGMIMPRRPTAAPKAADAGDAPSVWILRDGVATEVEVRPGETDGKLMAVTSDGLAEGDLAIIDQTTGG
jgi:multidrug efflux pump subunit AcrA (membrane-fusion protein)